MEDVPELHIPTWSEPCPYLPDRIARMPLRQPQGVLSRAQMDARLAAGERRCGDFLYRTECPACSACIPIRLPVARFAPSRTQRRVWRKGQQQFDVQVQAPAVSNARLHLYNKHRRLRGLDNGMGDISAADYHDFLVATCCETYEVTYRVDGALAAVAIVDRAETSLSAVYCYFDPDFQSLSPGVFSVLTIVDQARQWGLQHVYLGLYIAESPHMRYKRVYRPHEQLLGGRWVEPQEAPVAQVTAGGDLTRAARKAARDASSA